MSLLALSYGNVRDVVVPALVIVVGVLVRVLWRLAERVSRLEGPGR